MTLSRDTLLDTRLRLPEHVVHRRFITETVLLNLETGNYHGLNPVGGAILEAVNEADTVRDAVGVVAAEYDQDPDVVEPHTLSLCERLLERGLVQTVETPPDS